MFLYHILDSQSPHIIGNPYDNRTNSFNYPNIYNLQMQIRLAQSHLTQIKQNILTDMIKKNQNFINPHKECSEVRSEEEKSQNSSPMLQKPIIEVPSDHLLLKSNCFEDELLDSNSSSKRVIKSKKMSKSITKCPHKEARHYAKVRKKLFNRFLEYVQQLLPFERKREEGLEVSS
jgi:hypothetical protein